MIGFKIHLKMGNILRWMCFLAGLSFAECTRHSAVAQCPNWIQKVIEAYHECTSKIPITNFDKSFGLSGPEVASAFNDYCRHAPAATECAVKILDSQGCSEHIIELFLSMVKKSTSFCNETGELKEDVSKIFNDAPSVSHLAMTTCPFSLEDSFRCREFAQENLMSGLYGKKDSDFYLMIDPKGRTKFLQDLSTCLYSTIAWSCPREALLLTVVYEKDEWLPPRLGSNTSQVLFTLEQKSKVM